ncbi:PEP-CTERM sorting domain-containing protein [uncultured Thiodictyon sp.]|jgi:hypothetical protein|uniref:PEP-CTERM sorting domain-containing protein n=1 Tax=uncultured Thiodictyon sp. TaxID=1846217 RepID=UPI0025CBDD4E|nr:PEP-CTERM sorting domain-containing protein [uncultured Thiodictyon sp.]
MNGANHYLDFIFKTMTGTDMHTNTLPASEYDIRRAAGNPGIRIRLVIPLLVMAVLGCHAGSVAAGLITIGGYSLLQNQTPVGFRDTTKSFIASRFTVGANDTVINAIDYFGKGDGSTTPGIAIYSAKTSGISGGFEPGSLIPFATGNFLAGPSTSAFTPTTTIFTNPVTLTALSSYYVVVQGTLNTSIYIPAVGQSGQFSVITNGVTPVTQLLAFNGTWASYSSGSFVPYALVQQSEVPEPATILLMVIALSLLGIGRRGKSGKKGPSSNGAQLSLTN